MGGRHAAALPPSPGPPGCAALAVHCAVREAPPPTYPKVTDFFFSESLYLVCATEVKKEELSQRSQSSLWDSAVFERLDGSSSPTACLCLACVLFTFLTN